MGSFRAMQPISKTEVPVWYEGFCSHEKKGRCQRVRATPSTQKDAKGTTEGTRCTHNLVVLGLGDLARDDFLAEVRRRAEGAGQANDVGRTLLQGSVHRSRASETSSDGELLGRTASDEGIRKSW